MTTGRILAAQLEGTRDWTLKLIADLAGDAWSFQPGPGLAHPTWLCGHLAVSQHVLIFDRCMGRPMLPPEFVQHFPIGGPIKATSEHDYPPVASILDTMADMQRRTLAAVMDMADDLLREPAFGAGGARHPHYSDKLGAVTHCIRHEAFHAGQLATIRRLVGLPALR
ncbi:MAG: DinB family protein [Phycisphaerales bacterium]|nr:MAG: DinB family protein [Phycisphaerales bacterium]